jgi:nucleotidyltransferase/DNA polymerase involved in DNA repair
MKSAQLAPNAILLPANFDAYRDYSRRFKAAVATIAPQIEDRASMKSTSISATFRKKPKRWPAASSRPSSMPPA